MDAPPAPAPRRRSKNLPGWVAPVVFGVFVAAGVGVWYAGNRPANGVQFDAIQADLDRSLPPGSTRDEVRGWLAAHGVTESGDLRNAGGQADGIWATLPNDTWFEPADIHFQFRFQGEGNLKTATAYRARRI